MDRKDFLKKGLLGTGVLAATAAAGAVMSNNIDELRPIDQVGFNHLPNLQDKPAKNIVIHRASTRGNADHGWLKTNHTFSFANYYNPDRMNFGALRVINDDRIAAKQGFPTHPHDNMEIITIPLTGAVEHKDSMGNSGVIRHGEVQVMSAGTGIQHSEYNHLDSEDLTLLQIWVFPNKAAVTPRYDQIQLPQSKRNQLQQILSPYPDDAGVWIHQSAWFHLGRIDKGFKTKHRINLPATNGVYAFVIEGNVTINGQVLNQRDGMGIWDVSALDIKADSNAYLLLMEVPVKLS
jgi:quercetin 2,3-dioxygenase